MLVRQAFRSDPERVVATEPTTILHGYRHQGVRCGSPKFIRSLQFISGRELAVRCFKESKSGSSVISRQHAMASKQRMKSRALAPSLTSSRYSMKSKSTFSRKFSA